MQRSRYLAFPAAVTALLLAAPAPALAQDETQQIVVRGKQMPRGYGPVEMIVKIGDLNLSSRAGVGEMEKRVTNTIRLMCRINAPINASNKRESKTCSEFAWASARPQMDRAVRAASD
ncbi:UrcA family protein [Sphingomonas sp. GCM10030256]|uniref:UrcA family protein n=1 Tax=Sphingomonas sp. GCM10030256 TaxID=3273427 RepID=UPI00361E5E6B